MLIGGSAEWKALTTACADRDAQVLATQRQVNQQSNDLFWSTRDLLASEHASSSTETHRDELLRLAIQEMMGDARLVLTVTPSLILSPPPFLSPEV